VSNNFYNEPMTRFELVTSSLPRKPAFVSSLAKPSLKTQPKLKVLESQTRLSPYLLKKQFYSLQ